MRNRIFSNYTKNNHYEVNTVDFSKNGEFLVFSEFLQKKNKILFVKLKFFTFQNNGLRLMNEVRNPHVMEKID